MTHWFSCVKMTIWVESRDGVITHTAPVTKKFIGQPLNNLRNWMKRLGGFKESCL